MLPWAAISLFIGKIIISLHFFVNIEPRLLAFPCKSMLSPFLFHLVILYAIEGIKKASPVWLLLVNQLLFCNKE